MNTATVLQSDPNARHPQSQRDCLKLTVNRPWASGGVKGWATDLWCDPRAPAPADGAEVAWDHHRVWLDGVAWRKLELDSNSDSAAY